MESDHIRFIELIATYLADGLEGDERARFELHAAECPACAAELTQARTSEAKLKSLFSDAAPPAGFEDRMIAGLRTATSPRLRIHPIVRKTAAAVAASLLVCTIGYVASDRIQRSDPPQFVLRAPPKELTDRFTRPNTDVGVALHALLRQSDIPAEHWVAPSSNAEKWDFGGGANTALNWSNWKKLPQEQTEVAAVALSANRDRDIDGGLPGNKNEKPILRESSRKDTSATWSGNGAAPSEYATEGLHFRPDEFRSINGFESPKSQTSFPNTSDTLTLADRAGPGLDTTLPGQIAAQVAKPPPAQPQPEPAPVIIQRK
ncbi:MAG: zf-HC2 domain-containing protein, partial [Tepidisphaeraceae bacterium]